MFTRKSRKKTKRKGMKSMRKSYKRKSRRKSRMFGKLRGRKGVEVRLPPPHVKFSEVELPRGEGMSFLKYKKMIEESLNHRLRVELEIPHVFPRQLPSEIHLINLDNKIIFKGAVRWNKPTDDFIVEHIYTTSNYIPLPSHPPSLPHDSHDSPDQV
jgi:hypothetical protein